MTRERLDELMQKYKYQEAKAETLPETWINWHGINIYSQPVKWQIESQHNNQEDCEAAALSGMLLSEVNMAVMGRTHVFKVYDQGLRPHFHLMHKGNDVLSVWNVCTKGGEQPTAEEPPHLKK